MNELALANSLLAQCNDIEVLILADGRVKVAFTLNLGLFHHLVVVFKPDFFLQEIVASFLLCISTDVASVLSFNSCKVQNLWLLFFSIWHAASFATSELLGGIVRGEDSWSKVLSVQYPDFFLVQQDKEQTLRKEEALVDALRLTDVKAVKLHLWLSIILIHFLLVIVNTKLDSFAPGNCNHRVALVPEGRSQSEAPIKIGNSARLNVRRSSNADKWKCSRSHLSNVDFF